VDLARGRDAARPTRVGLDKGTLVGRWQWTAFPIVLFICSRIALLGFSQIAMTLVPKLPWEFGSRAFLKERPYLDGLCRWDCWHFAAIARDGYSAPVWTNFFPLFPLLARGLHELTGMPINLAIVVVPNVAGLGALLVIYRIFIMLASEEEARWGLALFAAYPFAFFQATGYPESLMIFFSALAILLALRGNHIWAGVALGMGTLARHLTLFAGAGMLAAQVRQRGLHPKRLLLNSAILGLVVPWLFLGAYLFYQYWRFGNPLAFAAARDKPPWGPMAWWGIRDLLATKDVNDHVHAMYSYLPFALLTTVGSLALLTRKEWIEIAAFGVIFTAVLWNIGMWGLGRYTASCWPAFLPLGVWLAKRPKLQGPAIAMLAIFQGLFFFLFSHMFPIL
jgi:hypothetical protein